MPKKTLITEAALAVLATSGFQVVQSFYAGGLEGVSVIAAGTFLAGLVTLIQRYRQKAEDVADSNNRIPNKDLMKKVATEILEGKK